MNFSKILQGSGARSSRIVGLALILCSACTYTVDSTLDAVDASPGDFVCATAAGDCTLRAAIEEANSMPTADLIVVPSGTYDLDLPAAAGGGELEITQSVTIQGAGRATTVIEQQEPTSRVLRISGGEVGIANLTLRGGAASIAQDGGGMLVDGGTVEVADVALRDNEAGRGGGIAVYPGTNVTLLRSEVMGNSGADLGGGVFNLGTLVARDSEISENEANRVGGVRNSGQLTLTNVTVSGNFARSPTAGTGGISQNGNAVLLNVTVTDNSSISAGPGSFRSGGIQVTSGSPTTLNNSLIAGNDGGPGGPDDCAAELGPGSAHNLIGSSQDCVITANLPTYILDVDPQLGSLQLNGGPTRNHAPLPGSAAIDAGGPQPPAIGACNFFDQRGVPRPAGVGPCDIGAVEVSPATPLPRILGFQLVDAATDLDIRPLLHGDVLALSELPPELSIRAEVLSVGSVVFDFQGVDAFQVENVAPYGLSPNPGGDFAPLPLPPGEYRLRATPFDGPNGSGDPGAGRSIRFRVFGGTALVMEENAEGLVGPVESVATLRSSLRVDRDRLATIEIGASGRQLVLRQLAEQQAPDDPQAFARAFSEGQSICRGRSCSCLGASSCNRLFTSTCAKPAVPAACADAGGGAIACVCTP